MFKLQLIYYVMYFLLYTKCYTIPNLEMQMTQIDQSIPFLVMFGWK